MDDLISRQAAIDALHMHLMYRMGTDINKKRLDEWINSLPSAQPEKRWIPCSERLPKVGERVLAQQINGAMQAMKCIDGGHLKWFYSRTVAWQPLPEPYRGGEKDE